MHYRWISILMVAGVMMAGTNTNAQKTDSSGLTAGEYTKATQFIIQDLDNESYMKFEGNKYVAERYENGKPYFITGDDGMKKRIDLYTLTRKGDPAVIGTLIYYTTEKGTRYTACLPGRSAPGPVWEKYFEDIHAIDKKEPFFVLKLSYVLSREFTYQQYKASLKGKNPDRAEAGTYGNDICFPGEDLVELGDGRKIKIGEVRKGDEIMALDPQTGLVKKVSVQKLVAHASGNYAITTLLLLRATATGGPNEWSISLQEIQATPNHPMATRTGSMRMGDVMPGQEILCKNKDGQAYSYFTVWSKEEYAKGIQPVYSLELSTNDLVSVNGVSARQK